MAYNIPNSGTSVGFYRGPQSNLNALTTFKAGAFYITDDTNRLYFAQSNSDLVYLNKSIQVFANASDLYDANILKDPVVDDFYYVTGGNILCYYNGLKNGQRDFIQVNAFENTSIKSVTVSSDVTSSKDLTITTSIQQQNRSGQNVGSAITGTVTITTDKIAELIQDHLPKLGDIQVTLGSTVANGTATVKLDGMGAAQNQQITINGTDGVKITSTADNSITIDGTTYKLGVSTDANSKPAVTLKSSDSATNQVSFVAGNSDISIGSTTGETSGSISISHKTYSPTELTGAVTESTNSLAHGDTVTILKGVELSNGHVTGLKTGTFKLPTVAADKYANAFEISGGTATITRSDGQKLEAKDSLYYTLNGEQVQNQGSLTEGVTAIAEQLIKDSLSTLTNAMVFKGGLKGGTEASPKLMSSLVTKPSVGDTYVVSEGFITITDAYDGTTVASAGDIIIASGTEGADGTIADPKWIVVEGEEVDTTYTLSSASNKISLKDQKQTVSGEITVSGDGYVNLTASDNKLQAAHKAITVGSTTGTELSVNNGGNFNIISGISDDGHGHITSIETTKINLPSISDMTNNHSLVGNSTGKKIELKNSKSAVQGTLSVENGTDINASVSVDPSDSTKSTIKFDHATISRTGDSAIAQSNDTLLSNGKNFTVVTGIQTSSTGHVTGVTTTEYKAVNTTYALSGATVTKHATNNSVSIVDTLKANGNTNAGTSTFSLSANNESNIRVNASGTDISVGLVWGTF